MVYAFRRLKEEDEEDGELNSPNLMQQPKEVHVVEEPMKEAPEYMNDVVKNVQEEFVEIDLNDGKEGERLVKIIKSLSEEETKRLITLLKEYKDVFAWSYHEMPGLSLSLVTHKLKEDPNTKLLKQPPRKYRLNIEEKIAEVNKLLKVGFIEEIECPSWLANIVLVKKGG